MNTKKQSAASGKHVVLSVAGPAGDAALGSDAALGGDAANENPPPAIPEALPAPKTSTRPCSSRSVDKGKGKLVPKEGVRDKEPEKQGVRNKEPETAVDNAAAEMAPKGESMQFKTKLFSELPSTIKRKVLRGIPPPCTLCRKTFPSIPELFEHLPVHGEDMLRWVTVTYDDDEDEAAEGISTDIDKPKSRIYKVALLFRAPRGNGPSLQRDNMHLDFDLNLLPPEAHDQEE